MFEAMLGGILGVAISALVAIFIAKYQRKQSYYTNLIKIFETHNWSLMEYQLDSGITVNDIDNKVAIVCYQHLNILFFAWLNKSIIEKDASLNGWKNWVTAIIEGANEPNRNSFNRCYRQILTHGDLYPKEFIKWLDSELELSAKKFPETIKN